MSAISVIRCLTPAAVIGLMATSGAAQTVSGSWEVCVNPSSGVTDGIQHWFLEFGDDGTYSRIVLSDNREQPFFEETGTYEISQEAITLIHLDESSQILNLVRDPFAFRLSAAGDVLYWGSDPEIRFARAGALSSELFGTWGILSPFDNQIAGQIRFASDGTFELDLGESHDRGVFVTAGSGLVSWPTESNQPSRVGQPAVWTDVRVEGDQLSYTIACSFTIMAVRLTTTAVRPTSWGQIKASLARPR